MSIAASGTVKVVVRHQEEIMNAHEKCLKNEVCGFNKGFGRRIPVTDQTPEARPQWSNHQNQDTWGSTDRSEVTHIQIS